MEIGLLLIYIIFLLYISLWNELLAVGIALGSVLFVKGKFARLKGMVGEWRVRWLLSGLGDEYEVYHNVYVPRGNGKLTQVDHVVVSRYQIFVLETKNYAGTVIGEEDELYWVQRLAGREQTFYNPVRQNSGHVKALKGRVGLDESVQSIVVFADETRLKVSPYLKSAKVLRSGELVAFVRKFKRKAVPRAKVERWNEVLVGLQMEKRRAGLTMRRKHLADVRGIARVGESDGRKNRVQRQISGEARGKAVAFVGHCRGIHHCPRCGKKLVLRNGKYGEFYGCNGFPECRYSVDVWKV